MNIDLERYPYLPGTDEFEDLWEAARDKWPNEVEDLGFIGHCDGTAYFQIRGDSEPRTLKL